MKLLLHIGGPKTGSTSLQHFLYANEASLGNAGYKLLKSLSYPNNIDLAAYFSRKIGRGLKKWAFPRGIHDVETKRLFFEDLRFTEKIAAEITGAESAHHTTIITSEHLMSELTSGEELRGLSDWIIENFDSVEIVCFVREQTSIIPSAWSTAILSGHSESLASWVRQTLASDLHDLYKIAELWSSNMRAGPLKFRVISTEPSSDICMDFAQTFLSECRVDELRLPGQRLNRALSRPEAEGYRWTNRLFPHLGPRPRIRALNRRFRRVVSRVFGMTAWPIILTNRQFSAIARHYGSSNRRFSEKFLELEDRARFDRQFLGLGRIQEG